MKDSRTKVQMKVNRIVVHRNPHLDEMFAIWILRNYGEAKFPGVSKAEIVIWGKKEITKNPMEIAAANGSLCVGLGGGMFDEHGGNERSDCATTLVAKHLGLISDPVIGFLAQAVYKADALNEGFLKSKADDVKDMNRYWVGSINVESLYQRVETMIQVQVYRRKEYLAAKSLFKERYRHQVAGVYVAAADKIDNCQYQHVARASGAGIVVQRDKEGLTQIFGNESLNMPSLAARIRRAEISVSKLRPQKFLNDAALSFRGTLKDVPQWYFEHDNLLNGSESFPDVPPSGISFEQMMGIVEGHIKSLDQGMKKSSGLAVAS